MKRHYDMGNPVDIKACGDEWAILAKRIGCELRGFDNPRSASFITPDRDVISIGPLMRMAIESLLPQSGMKITRTFTRRNDEKMTLAVEIDEEKIAETMAHRMALSGKTRSKAMDGGVTATVVGV